MSIQKLFPSDLEVSNRVFPQLNKVGNVGIFVLLRSEEQNKFKLKIYLWWILNLGPWD